jgi:HK97 family phage portal protein
MGIITSIFGKTINAEVDKQVTEIEKRISANIAAPLTNLFNSNLLQFLGDNALIAAPGDQSYIGKGYEAIGSVYECVDLILKKAVACSQIVYRIKDQAEFQKYKSYAQNPGSLAKMLIAKDKALEEVTMPQIEKLLTQPNPYQNGDDFKEWIIGLLLLTGNSYIYGNASPTNIKTNKWSEMWAIPARMNIISGGWMQPIIEYQVADWFTATFPAAQIKHIKTFNPKYQLNGSQLYGMSPLQPYLYQMDTLRNAEMEADKQVKSGGSLGIFSPENKEDQLTKEQKDDFGFRMKDAHASKDKLSRLIPVSIAMKYQQVGLSPADLQLLAISNAKAQDIYRAYHIPLQFHDQDSSTYNNLPMANRQMVYNAVCPILRKLDIALTEFLCTPYNTPTEKYVIMSDFTSLPELNDDMLTVAQWLAETWHLTPNEKRAVMSYGRSAETGMDQIWAPTTVAPISEILAGNVTPQIPPAKPAPAK